MRRRGFFYFKLRLAHQVRLVAVHHVTDPKIHRKYTPELLALRLRELFAADDDPCLAVPEKILVLFQFFHQFFTQNGISRSFIQIDFQSFFFPFERNDALHVKPSRLFFRPRLHAHGHAIHYT